MGCNSGNFHPNTGNGRHKLRLQMQPCYRHFPLCRTVAAFSVVLLLCAYYFEECKSYHVKSQNLPFLPTLQLLTRGIRIGSVQPTLPTSSTMPTRARLYSMRLFADGIDRTDGNKNKRAYKTRVKPASPHLFASSQQRKRFSHLREGAIVEHFSNKGTKQLALVVKRHRNSVELVNDAKMAYTIPLQRIVYLVDGNYSFGDLLKIQEMIADFKPQQLEKLWENCMDGKFPTAKGKKPVAKTGTDFGSGPGSGSAAGDAQQQQLSVEDVAKHLYGTDDPVRCFVAARVMELFGTVYFSIHEVTNNNDRNDRNADDDEGSTGVNSGTDQASKSGFTAYTSLTSFPVSEAPMSRADARINMTTATGSSSSDNDTDDSYTNKKNDNDQNNGISCSAVCYRPCAASVVQENLRDQAALREFKQRFVKIMTKGGQHSNNKQSNNNNSNISSSSSPTSNSGMQNFFLPEMSERMEAVLAPYTSGLQQFAYEKHTWAKRGWTRTESSSSNNRNRNNINNNNNDNNNHEQEVSKGIELLDYLGLAPSYANAKKVLEVTGVWSPHENVEKYLMQIRDRFPRSVLDEAQYLLENADSLEDPDERLRRDLRSLGTYAIDREGATEIDDAISIEYLEDGREKLWVHIADVSKWIRPGSELSLEAERRMASVYMPDERISMFPDSLSSELLSLGSFVDSFALSCGVTLHPQTGAITSYEVCPSKIRVTRRLTYSQLDDVLFRHRIEDERINSSDAEECKDGDTSNTSNTGNDTPLVTGGPPIAKNPTNIPVIPTSDNRSIKNNSETTSNNNDNNNDLMALSTQIMDDLVRLNRWAVIRHQHRINNGALDVYLRHKTELNLLVRDTKSASKATTVSGVMTWSNSSSICTVSEYMILMSQTIGAHCANSTHAPDNSLFDSDAVSSDSTSIDSSSMEAATGTGTAGGGLCIPVWYKTQSANPPITAADLELRTDMGETPFLRSARIMRHLHSARDSKVPGPHVTSGSQAYVQCTSPIRRYHDLYNHYRLKASMHAASMSEEWAHRAQEEAGISLLDSMATDSERLSRLDAIRLVTRHREQYWLSIYMNKLINASPQIEFDCLIYGSLPADDPIDGFASPTAATASTSTSASDDSRVNNDDNVERTVSTEDVDLDPNADADVYGDGFKCYEALILQLGSFTHYKLFHRDWTLQPGQLVKGHLYKRSTNPITHVLLPTDIHTLDALPLKLRERGQQLSVHPHIVQ